LRDRAEVGGGLVAGFEKATWMREKCNTGDLRWVDDEAVADEIG
jgi:hypothetical protein